MNHKPIEAAPALSDEWFAQRASIIGSSEAAKAVGMSEYGTPLQLYLEKTGQIEPFAGNEHTRRGRRYEPLIAEDWQELTGRKLRRYPCPMFIHPEHAGIAATPDGEIDDDEGLEIKSTTFRMRKKLGEQLSDDLPNDWVFQAQQQMAVMGWRVVHFCILVDLEPCVYKVDRNDGLIAMMISAELELLDRIKDRCPPEPTWAHASTPRLIREMNRTVNDSRIMLSDAGVAARMRYEMLAAEIKAREAEQEQLKARYEFEIGENFAGILPDGRMIRRKLIKGGPVSYQREDRWDYRAVKYDKGPIADYATTEADFPPDESTAEEAPAEPPKVEVQRIEFPPTEFELYSRAEMFLANLGYRLHDESESGSRYFRTFGNVWPTVRVSNHSANTATAAWMERNGVLEIRIDRPALAEQLETVESTLRERATA